MWYIIQLPFACWSTVMPDWSIPFVTSGVGIPAGHLALWLPEPVSKPKDSSPPSFTLAFSITTFKWFWISVYFLSFSSSRLFTYTFEMTSNDVYSILLEPLSSFLFLKIKLMIMKAAYISWFRPTLPSNGHQYSVPCSQLYNSGIKFRVALIFIKSFGISPHHFFLCLFLSRI